MVLLRNKAIGAMDESIEVPMELVKLISIDSVACVKPKLWFQLSARIKSSSWISWELRSRSQAQTEREAPIVACGSRITSNIGGLDHNRRLMAKAELKLWLLKSNLVQAGAEKLQEWRAESPLSCLFWPYPSQRHCSPGPQRHISASFNFEAIIGVLHKL
jgi:hypothetical protein